MKTKIITLIASFIMTSLFCFSLPLHAAPASKLNPPPKVNLNTVDAKTLSKMLKGVGRKRAEAVIAYRQAHHGFKSIDELAQVKSLGAAFVKKNRQQLDTLFYLEKKA